MIITVTLNPAVDKTVEIEKLEVGKIHRCGKVVYDSGGKGINVSKTILTLGGNSVAMGFTGGYFGMKLERDLVDHGISVNFVHIDQEIRTNTKIIDNEGVTEFNEAGVYVTEFEKERFMTKLMNAVNSDSIVVVSGSLPRGLEPSTYAEITAKVKSKGAKVFADYDGEAFKCAMEAEVLPDLLKPNRAEILKYFGEEKADQAQLIKMGKTFIDKGVKTVVLSCGADGALFFGEGKIYKSPALDVEVKSNVGAGDTMMAVFAYYTERGYSFEDTIKMAMAAAAGSVTTEGTKPADPEVVKELLGKVRIEEIG